MYVVEFVHGAKTVVEMSGVFDAEGKPITVVIGCTKVFVPNGQRNGRANVIIDAPSSVKLERCKHAGDDIRNIER